MEKWNVEIVTHRGLVREVNEDAAAEVGDALIVADGMGGYAAGEVASRLLVEAVTRALPPVSDAQKSEERLTTAIEAANASILAESRAHADYSGMGTTVVLLEHAGENVYWAHVGDSRLYRLRDGQLRRITRDHSLVADLVEQGTITEEEARVHPKRNLLTKAVGVAEKVLPETGRLSSKEDDIYILCSDGLTNMVDEDRIRDVLCTMKTGRASALCEMALQAGGEDNITVIVAEVVGVNQDHAS